MRYALVSTVSHLLIVDLRRRAVATVEQDRQEYYGISWFPGDERLALSHSGLNNDELSDLRGYALSEVGWVSVGEQDSRHVLSAPHQICCAPDGRVLCTNTGRNVVTVLDPVRPNTFQEAGISAARWDRLSPDERIGDHLNSVFLTPGKAHVIAHRFDNGSRLATFSYPEMQLLSSEPLGKLTGLHNVWITPEGRRIGCDSNNGDLTDLDTREPIWRSGRAILTRGLSACATHVLVGESLKTSRHLRRTSMSGLWVLDRRTWQTIDHLRLGPYGAVHEVRILDVPDEAHHGTPFAGLEKLLAKFTEDEWQPCPENSADAPSLIFGSPLAQGDGWLSARGSEACLLTWPTKETISFDYDLGGNAQAEIGLVLGYKGDGADSHMALLNLSQDQDGKVELQGWRIKASRRIRLRSWRMPFGLRTGPFPRRGCLSVERREGDAAVVINGKLAALISLKTLRLTGQLHGLGVRWANASVRHGTGN